MRSCCDSAAPVGKQGTVGERRERSERREVRPDGGVAVRSGSEVCEQKQGHGSIGGSGTDRGKTRYVCLVCGEAVTRTVPRQRTLGAAPVTWRIPDAIEWFQHSDGSADCFGDGSMGVSHRVAVELAAKRLVAAAQQVHGGDGESVSVQPETRVAVPDGTRWVETDVHLASPPVAVEVFTSISQLDLSRRLSVLFAAGYGVYLVFDVDGRYDPTTIEEWVQRAASVPVRVGRFDTGASGDCSARLRLGTLLSPAVIEQSELTGPDVPVFLQ